MSSIPVTPPHDASTSAQHHIKCAQKQEHTRNKDAKRLDYVLRAKATHIKRPRNATPAWEESTIARLTALPADHVYTCSPTQWLQAVKERIDISSRRADFRATFDKICDALSYALNPETGTLCITWSALAKLASTSTSSVQRILRLLKEHQLLTVIASGRSATMAPKGQEKKNLAPVYGLTVPTPPSSKDLEVDDSFYDDNGYLFVTDCPSPLRDEKISYHRAIREGLFDQFCKQRYALYAHTHRDDIEKKRQGLQDSYPTLKAKQQAITHLVRVLQHHCFDLRSLSATAITGVVQPFFEAGWTVRDVLYALERRADNSAYNTRGAAGMRSVKKWLQLRMSQWMSQGEVLPSRTAIEEQKHREQKIQREQESSVSKKVCGPSNKVKRRIKVALLGEKKARVQFPELF